MEKDFKRMGRAELLEALHAAIKEKDALENQKTEYQRQYESAKQHLDEADSRLAAVQAELTAACANLAAQQEKTAAQEKQLAGFDQQLNSAREQLAAAQEELSGERGRSAGLAEALKDEKAAHARAQEKIEALTRQLSDRVILKDNAGTLADAAIQINGVLAAAQTAADQYLENIERMHTEQEKSCQMMEAESREKAEQMIRSAEARCAQLEAQTKAKCEALKADAEKNVWQKWSSLSEQLKQISNEIHNTVHVAD